MRYIIDCLCKCNYLENTEKDYYLFGLKVLILNVLTILVGLIVSIIYRNLEFGICFLCIYVLMRINLGGYHCSKPARCILVFSTINLLINYLSFKINDNIAILLGLLSVLLLLIKNDPIKNNQNVCEKNIENSKKIIYLLIYLFIMGIIVCYVFDLKTNLLLISACYANVLNCILYYIELYRRKINEEEKMFI